MNSSMRIVVFGAGAWGTALAIHMAQLHPVQLWGRNEKTLNATSPTFEPRPKNLQIQANLAQAMTWSLTDHAHALWVLATPMGALRSMLETLKKTQAKQQPWPNLVWLCKGFEVGTGLMPHEVVREVLGEAATSSGTLTGPSFAAEVAQGLPCALAAASPCSQTRQTMLHAAHHGPMRVYEVNDLVGAEVGGAMKNIMAVAAGLSDGLGLGSNARAALLTRGMVELQRLAHALGGQAETLQGLSGLGDLILTCTGNLSRNRQVGLQLAKEGPQSLQHLGLTAEGVHCAPVVVQLAQRHGLELPICSAVNDVLQGNLSPQQAVQRLMGREPRHEA